MFNKPIPQRWYWADNKTRIRKGEFYAYGGLSNPRMFRKMQSGVWTYWRQA